MLFRFELVSVSENYGDYLAALEIPAYLIYFIQSSAESMIFEVIGDSWRWEIDKGQSKGQLATHFALFTLVEVHPCYFVGRVTQVLYV